MGEKHKKTSHKNDKDYKGKSRTERKRSREKKSQKKGQEREGGSEKREGCHSDHREYELEKKSQKELGKMSKMSFLLICLRY